MASSNDDGGKGDTVYDGIDENVGGVRMGRSESTEDLMKDLMNRNADVYTDEEGDDEDDEEDVNSNENGTTSKVCNGRMDDGTNLETGFSKLNCETSSNKVDSDAETEKIDCEENGDLLQGSTDNEQDKMQEESASNERPKDELPLNSEMSWDFSLRSLVDGFQTKGMWIEGAFHQKLKGECLHEFQNVACECEEKKKVSVCRLCHVIFCSKLCFRKARGEVKTEENLTPKEEIQPEPESLPRQENPAPLPSTSKNGATTDKPDSRGRQNQNRNQKKSFQQPRNSQSILNNRIQEETVINFTPHPHPDIFPYGVDSTAATAAKSLAYGLLPTPLTQRPLNTGIHPGVLYQHPVLMGARPMVQPHTSLLGSYPQQRSLHSNQVMSLQSTSQVRDSNYGRRDAVDSKSKVDQIPAEKPENMMGKDVPRKPTDEPIVKLFRNPGAKNANDVTSLNPVITPGSNPKAHSPQSSSQNATVASGSQRSRSSQEQQDTNSKNRTSTNTASQTGKPNSQLEVAHGKRRSQGNDALDNNKKGVVNSNGVPRESKGFDSSNMNQRQSNGQGPSNFRQNNSSNNESRQNGWSEKFQNGRRQDSREQYGNYRDRSNQNNYGQESGNYSGKQRNTYNGNGNNFKNNQEGGSNGSRNSQGQQPRQTQPDSESRNAVRKTDFSQYPIHSGPDFPVGILLPVKHISGNSFRDFSVMTSKNWTAFERLQSVLKTAPKTSKAVHEVGDYCLVAHKFKNHREEEWFRGVVTKVLSREIGVYLLDLGFPISVKPNAVNEILPNCLKYRPLAIRIKALNVIFDSAEDEKLSREHFESLICGKTIKVKITHEDKVVTHRYGGTVEVMHINRWYDAGDYFEKLLLGRKGTIDDFKQQQKNGEIAYIKPHVKLFGRYLRDAIGVGTESVGTITHVNSLNEFYVATRDSVRKKYQIESELNQPSVVDSFTDVTSLSDLSSAPCFVLFDEDSEQWVRVTILEVSNADKNLVSVKVLKLEDGSDQVVPLEMLKGLPKKELHASSCVYKCSLPVKPIARNKSSLEDQALEILKRNIGKSLKIVVLSVSKKSDTATTVEIFSEKDEKGYTSKFLEHGWVQLSSPSVDLSRPLNPSSPRSDK